MILVDYEPEEYAVNDARLYSFTFPCVGADAIEVYEVASTGVRSRVRIQDFTIRFASNIRDPLKYQGSVLFNRKHPDDIELVRIERNTLMDQTTDFRRFSPFNTRMIEFTLDKLTMIAQEINDRKCNVFTETPITQKITFGSYWAIQSQQINLALDKITKILWEIDQSGTDCRWQFEPYEDSAP